jgi:hypothetical protein
MEEEKWTEVSARLDAEERKRQANEARELRKMRERFVERVTFVIIGVALLIAIERSGSMSSTGVVIVAAAPEIARELVELLARL